MREKRKLCVYCGAKLKKGYKCVECGYDNHE